jgi:hypothetical protein
MLFVARPVRGGTKSVPAFTGRATGGGGYPSRATYGPLGNDLPDDFLGAFVAAEA